MVQLVPVPAKVTPEVGSSVVLDEEVTLSAVEHVKVESTSAIVSAIPVRGVSSSVVRSAISASVGASLTALTVKTNEVVTGAERPVEGDV